MAKTKKKAGILVSAIAAIAVCASLVVGATFALFTSEDKVDIAVTAGNVSVTATLGDPVASVISGSNVTGTNVSAEVKGNTITLDNMTPGDQVDFDITVKNEGTVSAYYRTAVVCEEGEILMSGLNFIVGTANLQRVRSYKSEYDLINEEEEETVHVTIALPERGNKIDNRYSGKSTKISYTIEAVQGNAAIENNVAEKENLVVAFDTEEAQFALDDVDDNTTVVLAAGEYDKLYFRPSHKSVFHEGGYDEWSDHLGYDRFFNNVTIRGEEGAIVSGFTNGSTLFNANGFPSADKPVEDDKTGSFSRAGYYFDGISFENITLKEGIDFTEGGWAPVQIKNIKIIGCDTTDDKKLENVTTNKILNSRADITDLLVENCKSKYRFQGVYVQSAKNVTVRNCDFYNTKHNAIAIQTGCSGNIVLEDNRILFSSDRAIRFAAFNEGSIRITDNIMAVIDEADGQLMKAESIGEGVDVVISDNYWDGKTDLNGVIVNMPLDENPIVTHANTLEARRFVSGTINFGSKQETFVSAGSNNLAAYYVEDGKTLVVNGDEGGVTSNWYGFYVGGKDSTAPQKLIINGGHYKSDSVVNVSKNGTVEINGGFFEAYSIAPYKNGLPAWNYLLNCIDSRYKDGTANIIVRGGTFVNFNPADNAAEGAGTNFVAEGYKSVAKVQPNGDVWYTVVKA